MPIVPGLFDDTVEKTDYFDTILSNSLEHEGGMTVDHAGPTNRGITQTTFDKYRKSMDLEPRPVEEIRDDEVYDVYRSDFYETPKIDKLPGKVAGVVFDFGINSSPDRAIRTLQRTVGATPDGVIGPKTLGAVESFIDQNGEDALVEGVINKREGFLKQLIKDKPAKYQKFENGWNNRIQKLRDQYLKPVGEGLSALNPFNVSEAQAGEIPASEREGVIPDLFAEESGYGNRMDGTPKGTGYFGELKMKDGSGRVATEISVGVEVDGKEMDIPTLVPTLTSKEKDYLLSGNKPTKEIVNKAVEHARKRIEEGKSVYSEDQPEGVVQGLFDEPKKSLFADLGENVNNFVKGIKIGDSTIGELGAKRGVSDAERIAGQLPEVTVEGIKKSFERGVASAQIDQASYLALTGELDYKTQVKPLKDAQKAIIDADPVKGKNVLSKALYAVAEMVPAMGVGITEGAATGAIAGGVAAAGGATAPLAIPLYIAGQTAGSFEYWRRQGAGQLYSEMQEKGIPDHINKPVAHIAGALYGAVEFSQVNKLIPGSQEASKKLIADSIQKTIGRLAAKYGINWASEVGEEGLQEVVMSSAKEVSAKVSGQSDKPNAKILADVMTNGWNAVKESALPMLLLMTPSAALDVKNISDEEKIRAEVRKGMVRQVIEEAKIQEAKEVQMTDVAKPVETISVNVTPEMEGAVETGEAPIEIKPEEVKEVAAVLEKSNLSEERRADIIRRLETSVEIKAPDTVAKETPVIETEGKGEETPPIISEEEEPIRKAMEKSLIAPNIDADFDGVGVKVKSFGKEGFLPLVENYKGRQIVKTGSGNIAVWDPKEETLFVVALDDTKASGQRFIDKSADTVENARKYIDLSENVRKERSDKKARVLKTIEGWRDKVDEIGNDESKSDLLANVAAYSSSADDLDVAFEKSQGLEKETDIEWTILQNRNSSEELKNKIREKQGLDRFNTRKKEKPTSTPPAPEIVQPGANVERVSPTKNEFNIGDVLDTQDNTNMASPVTIRSIEGNTLKFVDSKGTEFSGMAKAQVRKLIDGGSWKRIEKPAQEEGADVDTIASDFAGRLTQKVDNFHKRFAQAIIDKNPEFISQLVAQAETANRNARAIFVKYSGVELPKTISGKREAIYKWAGKEIPKPAEKPAPAPKMSKEDAAKKMIAARDEKVLASKIRYNGEIMTKKEMVDSLVAKGWVPVVSTQPKIKDLSRRAYNNMDGRQQADFERRQREAGTKQVYYLEDKAKGVMVEVGKVGYDYALTKQSQPEAKKSYSAEDIKAFAKDNHDSIIEQYAKENGNIVSVDRMKKLFAPVGYTGLDSVPYQAEAGKLAKEYFDKKLEEGRGSEKYVVLMTGGTGSGKSTILKEYEGRDILVFDLNLRNTQENAKLVQQIIDAGQKPFIKYVLRSPSEAFTEGVLKRATDKVSPDYGRAFSIEEHVTVHKQVRDTLDALLHKFGDKIKLQIIDNRGKLGESSEMSLAGLNKISYAYDEIAKELKNYVRQDKSIPDNLREQFLRNYEGYGIDEPKSQEARSPGQSQESGLGQDRAEARPQVTPPKRTSVKEGSFASKAISIKGVSAPEPILRSIAPKKAQLPILEYILIKDGKYRATDLDIGIEVSGATKPDGIYEFVGKDIVKSSMTQMEEDFPRMPIFLPSHLKGQADRSELIGAIERAAEFITDDDTRTPLLGIYFDVDRIVATDGRRLIMIPIKTGIKTPFIIDKPKLVAKALSAISGNSIKISEKEDAVEFTGDNGKVTIRKIDSEFPRYEQVIKVPMTRQVSIDKKKALSAMKEIAPYLKRQGNDFIASVVTMAQDGKSLIVSTQKIEDVPQKSVSIPLIENKDINRSTAYPEGIIILPMKLGTAYPEAGTFGMNPDYIVDAIKATDSDTVYISMGSNQKPWWFGQTEDEGFYSNAPVDVTEYNKKGAEAKAKKAKGAPGASVGTFTEEVQQASAKAEIEIKPIETIELVKLAKTIMDEYPTLKNFPKARGMFYGQGKGSIKLTPDLFKRGQEKQLASTLAHEIGHLVDYLPDRTLTRGNLLGRVASLRDYLKNFLPKLSSIEANEDSLITPEDREKIKKEVEKELGARPADSEELKAWRKLKKEDRGARPADSPAVKEWKRIRSERYAEAVIKAADVRGLVTHKDIRDEMIKLSFEWRPIEEGTDQDEAYMSYRSSGVEIYADNLSALLNSPGYVQQKAPKFFELFFEYLDRKPEFKEAYIAAQKMMNGTPAEIMTARQQDTRTMFAKGDAIREQLDKQDDLKENNIYERLRQMFDDKYYPILRKLEAGNRSGAIPKSNTAHLLQELDLVQNDVYLLTQKIDQTVIKPLADAGATQADLSEYMFLKRIIGKTSISNADIMATLKAGGLEDYFGELGIEIVDTKAEADALKQTKKIQTEAGEMTEEIPVTSWEEQIAKWKEKNADREDLANPLGFSPETAQKQIDFLHKQIGDTAFSAIEKSADKYHDLIFAVTEDAVKAGVYSQKVFDTVIRPNKNYYVSFGVLDYLDRTVPAGIKAQRGTLKEVESPFITTILKTISLIRANAKNRAVASAITELNTMYPTEVTKTKQIIIGGVPARFANPKGNLGQVKFMVDGKLVSYDVDKYIAESFKRDDPTIIALGAGLNKMLGNKYFKGLVITYSPAFQIFNIQRDLKRTYINLNALGHKVSVLQLLREYWKALPIAKRRLTGVSDATIEEMMKNKALDVPFNDFNYDDRDDGFARILRKYNVIGNNVSPVTIKDKLFAAAMWVDSAVRFVGNTIETLPKVASYNIMKEKKLSDQEIGYTTREYVGTPNFRTKGSLTKITNELFIFSNIMIQGTKADLRLATRPSTRAGYWWADFKANHALKLLMVAAAIGLAGKDLEDWFEKVPEYDKTNFIIIPLGTDSEGRARYFRMPHNETSRVLSAILWKIATAGKKKSGGPLEGVFSVAGGQLPSVSPTISVAGAWGTYLAGKNPYDSFRGQYAISEQAFNAGGWPKLKKMVEYTFNDLGFSQFTTYDDRRDTTFEAVAKGTPVINSVFRIVKTSDYGLAEKARALSQEETKETAERNLKRFDLFQKRLKGYSSDDISRLIDNEGKIRSGSQLKKDLHEIALDLYDGEPDKNDIKTTEKAFIRHALKEYNNPYIKAVLSAQSNDAKVKVLKEAKDALSANKYNEIINKLRKTRLISKEVIHAVDRLDVPANRP